MRPRFARRLRAGLVVALAAMVAALSAQGPVRDQARPPAIIGRASLSGTVVSDDPSRTPLRRVTLTLSRSGLPDARVTVTDDRGRYLFRGLPADTYTLSASKGGYVPSSYGATRIGLPGSPIPLVDGQAFVAAPIPLTRGGVITGRITNGKGQPVATAVVEAAQVATINGEHRPRTFPGSTGSSRTDRRGEYRIFGLAPGEFVVRTQDRVGRLEVAREMSPQEIQWAMRQMQPGAAPIPAGTIGPPAGRHMANSPTFYPGTALAENAVTITLGRGEERAGVDFPLLYVPVARVSGVVVGPDGRQVGGAPVVVSLRSTRPLSFRPLTPNASSLADGTFSVGDVWPGEFVVSVRTLGTQAAERMAAQVQAGLVPASALPPAGGRMMWGRAEVAVNGENVENVRITLRPGLTVTGKVVFDGAVLQPPADLTRVAPRLLTTPDTPVGLSAAPIGKVSLDGTFQITDLAPGSYTVLASLPPVAGTRQWTLRSATIAGRDVLDQPLEVRPDEDVAGLTLTFTDRQAAVAGTLIDANTRPTPQFFVLVYPADRRLWTPNSRWIKSARAGVDGSFKIAGLPAGEYHLSALTELEPTQQSEPAFLEQLVPASLRITLTEGQTLTQVLKVG